MVCQRGSRLDRTGQYGYWVYELAMGVLVGLEVLGGRGGGDIMDVVYCAHKRDLI